jgi:hypothetical protein
MTRFILVLFLVLTSIAPASAQAMFASQQQAQLHCPNDVVVWLNIPTGIYHMQGMRWYGATKNGAYVCEKEADGAGDRETRNGQ